MIKSIDIKTLATLTSGKIIVQGEAMAIQHVITDSRNIIFESQAVFIALTGPNYDGAHYIHEAYHRQVRVYIIQSIPTDIHEFQNATFILVEDTLKALQALAIYQRNHFMGQVIGITGSNGKTIIKEWLGLILATKYPIAKSPKSYNSQVGVPLSIFGIAPYHKIAILEAGISKPGEMTVLNKMISPNLVIYSNLGTAHQEGFETLLDKAFEKSQLGNGAHYIIYRKDHLPVSKALEERFDGAILISWSQKPGSDYTFSVKKGPEYTKIMLIKPDFSLFTFSCSFSDEASLENICHVITACLTLGFSEKEIQSGLQLLKPLEMRLTLKQGIHNSLIIDDTYNNDLEGLKVALDFMQVQRPKKRKILVLSDFLQVGAGAELYNEVSKLLTQYKIDHLYGIGDNITLVGKCENFTSEFYPTTDDFITSNLNNTFDHDLILVTGARTFKFEKIVNYLQQRVHGTTLEINLNALTHNYNFYRHKIDASTKIMVMVKAFAYGGGPAEIANHLQQLKADYLAVAYTDEGVYLREQGITLPIMVMNPSEESFFQLSKHHLEPVVYSLNHFKLLGNFCIQENKTISIHLDLDTGMHRLGISLEEIPDLNKLIHHYKLPIVSLYTHLAGADEQIHETYSIHQLNKFIEMTELISAHLTYKPLRHALNSAGIISYPQYQLDMVRLGIGLYGIEITGKEKSPLKSISTLKTTISQIKTLQKGQTIGYSRKGIMLKDGKIATISIGYADGYDRRFSNGVGFVLIAGQKAPVIGNVCMDMTMVDITDIQANEGDEVMVYGEGISLQDLASSIGTIPYELLTNISSRVKRIYYVD
ncbi:bifunctional UDP-N-acetylmuramoyl-tripeptide:D-alanyl-D-alanine ligase/alanine racemase [Anditalea andensis]|uniref:Alanine racemase n=1 Tax=Anditalea andensis TaxID=1048983 RepID=A0A074KT98_9BACT|nr:bifunctional UDP-N-acetylmuramoyl-tripeptide:D-alanyl-D-alanine ligase/alanine racemase [Anditalea andensis]KEO73176.1 Mur ligase [Anditalea andensis]